MNHWAELDKSRKSDLDLTIEEAVFDQARKRVEGLAEPAGINSAVEPLRAQWDLRLTDALFLFWLRRIQNTPKEGQPELWMAYKKYWRARLPREAFQYLQQIAAEIHHRGEDPRESTGTETEGKQLTMQVA